MIEKKDSESFMQGIIALIFSQIIIKILGLTYSIYLTNRKGFGDNGNAIYMSGYQIYALLLTLSSIGVPNAISKLVSERIAKNDYRGADRIFKIAFFTFSFIGFLGTLVLFFSARFISNVILEIPEAEYTLMTLAPAIFFVSVSSVIRGYCNGIQKMSITAKSQTIEQVFKTTLTIVIVEIIAVFSNVNTKLMAAGANLATTLATILSFTYIFTLCKITRNVRSRKLKQTFFSEKISIINTIKNIMSVSIPMAISSLLSVVNKNIDSITVVRILKEKIGESIAKAKYGILSTKVDTLTVMPLAFNIAFATALVPSIASAKINNDIKAINEKLKFSILITIFIGLPCSFGMAIYSKQILYLLFPNASEGYILLRISSISIIFTVLTQTINGAIQGLGKIKVPAIALGCGVIVKLLCNIILISIDGIYENGAAISSVICHVIVFLIVYSILKNTIELNFRISKMIIKPIIATSISITFSYLCNLLMIEKMMLLQNIATVISILIAVIIYLFCVIIFKIFSKNDFYMFPNGEKIYIFLKKLHIY